MTHNELDSLGTQISPFSAAPILISARTAIRYIRSRISGPDYVLMSAVKDANYDSSISVGFIRFFVRKTFLGVTVCSEEHTWALMSDDVDCFEALFGRMRRGEMLRDLGNTARQFINACDELLRGYQAANESITTTNHVDFAPISADEIDAPVTNFLLIGGSVASQVRNHASRPASEDVD